MQNFQTGKKNLFNIYTSNSIFKGVNEIDKQDYEYLSDCCETFVKIGRFESLKGTKILLCADYEINEFYFIRIEKLYEGIL